MSSLRSPCCSELTVVFLSYQRLNIKNTIKYTLKKNQAKLKLIPLGHYTANVHTVTIDDTRDSFYQKTNENHVTTPVSSSSVHQLTSFSVIDIKDFFLYKKKSRCI